MNQPQFRTLDREVRFGEDHIKDPKQVLDAGLNFLIQQGLGFLQGMTAISALIELPESKFRRVLDKLDALHSSGQIEIGEEGGPCGKDYEEAMASLQELRKRLQFAEKSLTEKQKKLLGISGLSKLSVTAIRYLSEIKNDKVLEIVAEYIESSDSEKESKLKIITNPLLDANNDLKQKLEYIRDHLVKLSPEMLSIILGHTSFSEIQMIRFDILVARQDKLKPFFGQIVENGNSNLLLKLTKLNPEQLEKGAKSPKQLTDLLAEIDDGLIERINLNLLVNHRNNKRLETLITRWRKFHAIITPENCQYSELELADLMAQHEQRKPNTKPQISL